MPSPKTVVSVARLLLLPMEHKQAHQALQQHLDTDDSGAAPDTDNGGGLSGTTEAARHLAAPPFKQQNQPLGDWDRNVMHAVTKDGGFTFHDHIGDGPKNGYMVSIDKHSEETVPLRDMTPQRVADYMSVHQQDLKDSRNYLGGWVYKGKVYLDVSRHSDDRNEAMRLGNANSQLGIYDIGKGETVLTDYGTKRQQPQQPQQVAASLVRTTGSRLGAAPGSVVRPDGTTEGRLLGSQRDEPVQITADTRRCESCGGAMPSRTHRQRDQKGRLVCDSCTSLNLPSWSTTHSSLSLIAQAEMRRREAEAIVAITRTLRLRREAHDTGDNAILNHCPFCGSGAVVRNSDNSTSCDFCHNTFTVQVQPSHPFMPQTVDGQPNPIPGMPGDTPTEVSGPNDPTVEESDEDVAADPLGDADPTVQSNGPVAPGQPPAKQPPPPGKNNQAPPTKPGQAKDGDDKGDGKKKNLPPWLKNKKSSLHMAEVNWDTYGVYYNDKTPVSVNDEVRVPGIDEVCHVTQMDTRTPDIIYVQPHTVWQGYTDEHPRPIKVNVKDVTPVETVYQHFHHQPGPPGYQFFAKQAFRTSTGHTLNAEAYMAHLALAHADQREAVLDSVRLANLQRQAAGPEVKIVRAEIHYGTPVVWVEPYDTVDRNGQKVQVTEFISNGVGYYEAKAWPYKKDGTLAARWSWSIWVDFPEEVRTLLDQMAGSLKQGNLQEQSEAAVPPFV